MLCSIKKALLFSASLLLFTLPQELGVKNAMMHAFDGNAKAAKLGCDQDFYFSIPASVMRTEKDVQKEKLIQTVPLDRLLLETDSPTLCKSENALSSDFAVSLSPLSARGLALSEIVVLLSFQLQTVRNGTNRRTLR